MVARGMITGIAAAFRVLVLTGVKLMRSLEDCSRGAVVGSLQYRFDLRTEDGKGQSARKSGQFEV